MRRLMEMVAQDRVDLTPLVTHRFALDDIHDAFEVFSQQRGGVLKVALSPTLALGTTAGRGSEGHGRCLTIARARSGHERTMDS